MLKQLFGFSTKAASTKIPYGKFINNTFSFFGHNSPEQLMREGYVKNPHVYSTVRAITDVCVKFGIDMKEKRSGEWEDVDEHQLLDLLDNPNTQQGRAEFITEVITYKLVIGEVFIHKLSPDNGMNKGKVTQLEVIAPTLVKDIKCDEYGEPVTYVINYGSQDKNIPSEDIIHLRYFNPDPSSKRGMSPLSAAAKVLQASNDAKEAQMKMLQNMGPAGILTGEDDSLNEEQAGKLKTKLMQLYNGAKRAGEWLVTGVKLKWVQIGANPVDLNISTLEKFNQRDIANVYGVPTILLGDPDSKTFANYQEARKHLINNVAEPAFRLLIDELTRSILEGNQKLIIDKSAFDELKKDENALIAALAQAWWLTPNERRLALGYESHDDDSMDELWTPTSIMPSGDSVFGVDELEKSYKHYVK